MRQIADKNYTCNRCTKVIKKGSEIQVDGVRPSVRIHTTCFYNILKPFPKEVVDRVNLKIKARK